MNLTCEPTEGDVTRATESIPPSATASPVTPTTTCGTRSWPRANATITVDGTDTLDAVVELLEGSCGNLSSLDALTCDLRRRRGGDRDEQPDARQHLLRAVYDWYNGFPEAPTFTICIVGDVSTGVPRRTNGGHPCAPTPRMLACDHDRAERGGSCDHRALRHDRPPGLWTGYAVMGSSRCP